MQKSLQKSDNLCIYNIKLLQSERCGGKKKAQHNYAVSEIIEVFLKYCILKKCTA